MVRRGRSLALKVRLPGRGDAYHEKRRVGRSKTEGPAGAQPWKGEHVALRDAEGLEGGCGGMNGSLVTRGCEDHEGPRVAMRRPEEAVMVDCVCQLDWVMGHPESW